MRRDFMFNVLSVSFNSQFMISKTISFRIRVIMAIIISYYITENIIYSTAYITKQRREYEKVSHGCESSALKKSREMH